MELSQAYDYLEREYEGGDDDSGGGVGVLFRGGDPGPDDVRPLQAETFGGDFAADLEAFLARGVPVVGGDWTEDEPAGGAGAESVSLASLVVGGNDTPSVKPDISRLVTDVKPVSPSVETKGGVGSLVVGGDGPPPSEEEIESVTVEATGGTLEALLTHIGGEGEKSRPK